MKKILLTGSTSFLGTKFLEMYSDKYDILGISLNDRENPVDFLDFDKLYEISNNFNPDIIIHLAAVVDNDNEKVRTSNILGTENIVKAAKNTNTPIVFLSSESVYGGKEEGNYVETDLYNPRSIYGETKVESEKLIINSGLNYLILRAHRFVGFSQKFNKSKQFKDTILSLTNNKEVHLDSKKLFKPCLINHINEIVDYYIQNELDKKIIMNVGVDKSTTYFDLIIDVATKLDLNIDLVFNDGEEKGWSNNMTLSLELLNSTNYPKLSYNQMLETLNADYKSIKVNNAL